MLEVKSLSIQYRGANRVTNTVCILLSAICRFYLLPVVDFTSHLDEFLFPLENEWKWFLLCFLSPHLKVKTCDSGGIRTHASEETGALNQRLRPLGHAISSKCYKGRYQSCVECYSAVSCVNSVCLRIIKMILLYGKNLLRCHGSNSAWLVLSSNIVPLKNRSKLLY